MRAARSLSPRQATVIEFPRTTPNPKRDQRRIEKALRRFLRFFVFCWRALRGFLKRLTATNAEAILRHNEIMREREERISRNWYSIR